jgi:hypothetical protein
VAIAAAVVFLVWLLFISGDDDSDSGTEGLGGQQIEKSVEVVSAAGVPAAVAAAGYPVYWLGPRGGVDYEVTLITDGRTYIRYLPKAEQAEAETPYLTVGSYSQSDAVTVIERLGAQQGADTQPIPNGGLALVNEGGSTGVYVAFPDSDTQIEIYDPRPGRALELAESGALTEVG